MAELDDLVDEMASLLQTPCTLEDADLNLVSYSGQTEVDPVRRRSIMERRSTAEVRDWFHAQGIRESPGPIRTPADHELGISSRLCIPARHLNRAQGYFWLLDPGQEISQTLWPAAMRIAEIGALLISQSSRHQTRLDLFYQELIEGDRGAVRSAAREVAAASGLHMSEPVVCILLDHAPDWQNLATQSRGSGAIWFQESSTRTAVIVRQDVEPNLTSTELLDWLGYRRTLRLDERSVHGGIGPRVKSLEDVRRSRWGALTALRVARSSDAARVGYWDALGALKLLSAAADQNLAEALINDRLHAFLTEERSAELVRTARVYLDAAGSVARAAAILNIHRQTLYHRLEQIERECGVNLKRGADRSHLHIALLLAEFIGPSQA